MSHEPAAGQPLGNYLLAERLGRGPHCVVWRGLREADGAAFALKVLDPRCAEDPATVSRFEAEAALARSLDHPHIVRVHEVVMPPASPLPFFVMDHLPGGHLGQFRGAAAERFPELVRLFVAVSGALEHIHRRGLVHCDVKATNVLLDAGGRPFLTDFGMAASPDEIAEAGPHGGTIAYMAPEQFETMSSGPGGAPVGPPADVYALGVLMYEVFTGQMPYRAGNRFALMYQRGTSDPRPPWEVRPEVPESLGRVILKAMAREPDERYPTAGAVAEALGA
jgi:serine/threonine-protein kinase